MSRKNITLIIIMVLLFGGTGVVIYKGFFAAPASTPAARPAPTTNVGALPPTGLVPGSPATASPASPVAPDGAVAAPAPAMISSPKILPLGIGFDLTMVKKYNADGKLFNYPKVGPTEIGPALGDIVRKSP